MSTYMKCVLQIVLLFAITETVYAECFGSGEYQVCSDSYTDSSGNVHIRSWDNQGNNYSVNSETYTSPSGDTTIRSYDNQGNSYSVRSWSDSTGIHSEDSEGNRYSITNSGAVLQTKKQSMKKNNISRSKVSSNKQRKKAKTEKKPQDQPVKVE